MLLPNGRLSIYSGATSAAYGSPTGGTNVLATNTWYYIEVKVTVGNTGSYEVRVDGETDSAASNVDTQNGSTTTIRLVKLGPSSSSNPSVFIFDDFYICDSTGSMNNDFLGDCRVVTLRPSGNGSTSDWTGSDGNSTDNYLLIDEAPINTTDYLSNTGAGDVDRYTMGNLTHYPTTVFGVQLDSISALVDIAEGITRPLLTVSGTDYAAQEFGSSGSYRDRSTLYEFDPSAGSPSQRWTRTKVNAAELGIESL